MFQDHLRLAFAASLAFHLLFVTGVEAGVLFSKMFDSRTRTPAITFRINTQAEPASASPSPFVFKDESGTSSSLSAGERGPAGPAPESRVSRRALKGFERFQHVLDGRIKRVRNQLVALVAEKQELPASEWVRFQIADWEKIPVEAREELVPDYLQRMRYRIAGYWAESIGSLADDSAVGAVRFRIYQGGTVSRLTLLSATGGENFKNSCLTAVSRANPFEPLPFVFKSSPEEHYVTIVLTFHLRKAG